MTHPRSVIGFGSWRFFLAFLVVISHLWSNMIHGPAAYAVWGFFVLSGFLMTHVLSHKYGMSTQGLKDFAYNRFLRIFPMYAVACVAGALALVLAARTGLLPSSLNPQFIWPANAKEWFANVTLLPLPSSGLLVPVSGALAVEVGAYILMPLMAFSRPAAWIGLILSLLLNASHGFEPATFAVRYSSFLTSFWVFAMGSLVAHHAQTLSSFKWPAVSMTLWGLHCLVWIWYDSWPWTYGLYASVFLSAWVVLSLSSVKAGASDGLLGDMSYPIYLFHTVVGAFILPLGLAPRSFLFFVVAFIATLAISWLLVVTIDRRVNSMKRRKDVKMDRSVPAVTAHGTH
jgi:peptidoglycan/LPS O-acetylase OafA/YrhL